MCPPCLFLFCSGQFSSSLTIFESCEKCEVKEGDTVQYILIKTVSFSFQEEESDKEKWTDQVMNYEQEGE